MVDKPFYCRYAVFSEYGDEHHVMVSSDREPLIWKRIATFPSRGRAESYAEIENSMAAEFADDDPFVGISDLKDRAVTPKIGNVATLLHDFTSRIDQIRAGVDALALRIEAIEASGAEPSHVEFVKLSRHENADVQHDMDRFDAGKVIKFQPVDIKVITKSAPGTEPLPEHRAKPVLQITDADREAFAAAVREGQSLPQLRSIATALSPEQVKRLRRTIIHPGGRTTKRRGAEVSEALLAAETVRPEVVSEVLTSVGPTPTSEPPAADPQSSAPAASKEILIGVDTGTDPLTMVVLPPRMMDDRHSQTAAIKKPASVPPPKMPPDLDPAVILTRIYKNENLLWELLTKQRSSTDVVRQADVEGSFKAAGYTGGTLSAAISNLIRLGAIQRIDPGVYKVVKPFPKPAEALSPPQCSHLRQPPGHSPHQFSCSPMMMGNRDGLASRSRCCGDVKSRAATTSSMPSLLTNIHARSARTEP